jgi:predicted AAA+ superfamily ATPase
MERFLMSELIAWKNDGRRKPLILKGARQVGKTWLLREFGRLHFENTAYINFENNERMDLLFQGDYDVARLTTGLEVESGQKIFAEKTLVIFDEVQENGKAVSSLKYFSENAPDYAIAAAGSLLGIFEHKGFSFPVGKVNTLELYPLSFTEFLTGMGESKLAELLKNTDWELIKAFNGRFIDWLRKFYYIGGMPEVVSIYLETKDLSAARKKQNELLNDYASDFSKHAPKGLLAKIHNIWDGVPRLLSRENKKFSPGVIKKNSRTSDYLEAIRWIVNAGLIYMAPQVSKPGIPLKSYATDVFKLYIHDVGLLSALTELDDKTLLEGDKIFKEFKGSLTEQYVCQELKAMKITPYYWSSEHTAEVDFVIKSGGTVYPLEVKAEENLQSKSLKVYRDKFQASACLRTSMRDYRNDGWVVNIPLYALSAFLERGL